MKVLIVDDIIENRLALFHFLKKTASCDLAENGLFALSQFKTAHEKGEPYDLILLDLMMPEMDGIECLQEIRKIEGQGKLEGEQKAKVVIITALDDREQIKRAFDAGCQEYLVKPVLKANLTKVLNKLFPDLQLN
ncbi:MAG: response regulator [bacterium]|nr:response regulator [bacterium]